MTSKIPLGTTVIVVTGEYGEDQIGLIGVTVPVTVGLDPSWTYEVEFPDGFSLLYKEGDIKPVLKEYSPEQSGDTDDDI